MARVTRESKKPKTPEGRYNELGKYVRSQSRRNKLRLAGFTTIGALVLTMVILWV